MSEIELVLKSPTDRIAPFSVKCNNLWTIKQLKNHIKEVYPCKPSIESQKVIYVGKLLKDDQIIKDIFEPNSSTIVHFICQSSINEPEKEIEKPKEKMEMTPELYEEYQAYINSYYSSTTQSFSAMNQYQQMMWINQAYMQTYANYCAQFQKNTENVPHSAISTEVVQPVAAETPVPNQENPANNDQQIDGAAGRENGMQNMMAAAFGGLMGDGGEDDNGGDVEPRDILHYFYVLVRFGLLLLICYYYSSVVSVITTLMLFFLFFGVNILRRNNNQRQQQQPPPAPVPPVRDNEVPASVPAAPSDDNAPPTTVPDRNVVGDTVASGSLPEAVTQTDMAPTITERLKRVASTSLQFVLTFFVTLFPEPIAHIDIN